MTTHTYGIELTWTGNTGTGTSSYRGFSRDHEVSAAGPGLILGSSDPAFRGDAARWNPEQLSLASIAQCHLLWYLHLAAQAGVIVTAYEDRPSGVMVEEAGGAGQFESVTLHPTMTITADSDPAVAEQLHERVGDYCFVARSIRTPIHHEVVVRVEEAAVSATSRPGASPAGG